MFTFLYLAPAVLALIGGLGHFSSGSYMFLKVLFVIDGIFHLWTFSQMWNNPEQRKNPFILTLLVPVLAGITAIISVLVHGGLPKTLWVIVDVAYAVIKFGIIITKRIQIK